MRVPPPKQKGTQQDVLNAIKQGVSETEAICSWLGVDEMAVRNAIRRLLDKGEIRRSPKGYEPVTRIPELERVWR